MFSRGSDGANAKQHQPGNDSVRDPDDIITKEIRLSGCKGFLAGRSTLGIGRLRDSPLVSSEAATLHRTILPNGGCCPAGCRGLPNPGSRRLLLPLSPT